MKAIISTVKFNFDPRKKVSKAKIRHTWHQLFPLEPLPEINAYAVSKEEFFSFQNQVREHHERCGVPNHVEACSIKEWGEVVEAGACVIKTKDKGYMILIRSDFEPFKDNLIHELKHIHNGDVEKEK